MHNHREELPVREDFLKISMPNNGIALVLTLLIVTTLAEHSTSTLISVAQKDVAPVSESDKRSQTAILHNLIGYDKYQEAHEGGGSQLDEPNHLLDRLFSKDLKKRASMHGFQGMRGKKSSFKEDKIYEKRVPMSFQGMRGKKNIGKALNEYEDRATASSFQDMRGKKTDQYNTAQQQGQLLILRSKPQQQMRGPNDWRKRRSMGFQSIHGRKSSFHEELDEFEKRALLGFHGMRGKKNTPYESDYARKNTLSYVEKRPMMGFYGMRGKRSPNYHELQH